MCSLLITLLLSLSPMASVSLLTCEPGDHLYERYGHTAIRVCDPMQGIDWVYNYGLFSFEDSHFYWNFVQGKTWYSLGKTSYSFFCEEYVETHRKVYQQPLLLSSEEKDSIFHALIINARPENCLYLYNFVFDNCATRPYHLIQSALGNTLVSSYSGWEGASYREFIHHYTRHGSWAEFGINLVFGWKADQPISGEERLFLPEALMCWMQEAHRSNGAPLVAGGRRQVADFVIEPVKWYESWYFGLLVLVLVLVLVNIHDRRRNQRTRWVDYVLYTVYALLGALLIFLIFFSIHPLVSIGWFVFIIPAIHLCSRLIYIWR